MKNGLIIFYVLLFMGITTKAQTGIRDDAGLQGSAGALSGFFETHTPVNYPAGASSWWHLLDVRHSNPSNNYAMQFAGSFFDQYLYFRKTQNNSNQSWSKVLLETDGKVGIGTLNPENNEGWQTTLGVHGEVDAKTVISTSSIITGIWSHNNGFYGALPGGMTGTYSNSPFSIITNKQVKMTVMPNGDVGIGTTSPTEKLSVNGKIRAKEVKIEVINWPDYVFKLDYKLPSLLEIEKHINEKGHLPDMPVANEVEKNGIALGEMNKALLKKIEEITLYLIELKKENNEIKKQISDIKK